jgi:hypothetical protein
LQPGGGRRELPVEEPDTGSAVVAPDGSGVASGTGASEQQRPVSPRRNDPLGGRQRR